MDKPKHKRATESQLQERISKAFTLLRQGHPESRICKMIAETEKVSLRTAERAVKLAKELMDSLGAQPTERQKGKLIARIDHLFAETTTGKDKNLDQAIKVVSIEAKLLPKTPQTIGKVSHEPTNPTATPETTLSPELQRALKQATGRPASPTQLSDTGSSQ